MVVRIPDRSCCHHCHCHGHAHCCEPFDKYHGLRGTVKQWSGGKVLEEGCENMHGIYFAVGQRGALCPGCTYEVLCVTGEGVEIMYDHDDPGGGNTLPGGVKVFLTHKDFTKMSGGLSLKPGIENIVKIPAGEVVIRIQYDK